MALFFKGMTPLVSMDDAPVDNLSTIAALREHRDTEGLGIDLDTSVHTLTLQNKIQQLEEALKNADKKDVQNILNQVNSILNAEILTEEEKTALQNLKIKAEALLKSEAPETDDTGLNNKDPQQTQKPQTPTEKSPKTGDADGMMPFVLLFVTGGAVSGIVISKKKKMIG